jgi:IMP dehydrogenase
VNRSRIRRIQALKALFGAVDAPMQIHHPRSIFTRLLDLVGLAPTPIALSLHDLCFRPFYSAVQSRAEPRLNTRLTKNVKTALPWVPANMQAVINRELGRALVARGIVPIYHRYLGFDDQSDWVREFRDKTFVSCGVRDPKTVEKVRRLLDAGALGTVIDITHGDSRMVLDVLESLKYSHPEKDVMTGNICTYEAAVRAINAGADGLKVGMGPGSPCTTRIVTRVGVPQATALAEVVAAALPYDIPVCADGGVEGPGESNICIGLGASTIMAGKIFARTLESASGRLEQDRRETDKSDRSPQGIEVLYFGEASAEARSRRRNGEITPGTVPEGEANWIPVTGPVEELLQRLDWSLRSSMTLTGQRSLPQFQRAVRKHRLLTRTSTSYTIESGTRLHH